MDEKRRYFKPEQKMAILREYFKNKGTMSELCERYSIHPNILYRWEKELFEGGIEIFSGGHKKSNGKEAQRMEEMEAKLRKKEEVIAWLTQENMELKKSTGEL